MESVIISSCNMSASQPYFESYNFITATIPTMSVSYPIYVQQEQAIKLNESEIGRYSVIDIANWFLSKKPMTHTKLQKLCYYAQAWCYALKEYRLEDTEFEAWINGPVSPLLWEKFKIFGYDCIQVENAINTYVKTEDELFLEDVWDTYGDSTGNALEALSCRELPWTEARKGYAPYEKCTVTISHKTMAEYYKSIYIGE